MPPAGSEFFEHAIRLVAYTGCCLAGSVFAKRCADAGSALDLGISLAAYTAATLVILPVLRTGGLGWTLGVAAMAQVVLATGLGWLLFAERLSPHQLAGLVLALAAMALMNVPHNPSQPEGDAVRSGAVPAGPARSAGREPHRRTRQGA